MPEKKDLSLEETEGIQFLYGKISPSAARKRFGIGTTRLYRIWRDVENVPSVDRKTPVDHVSAVGKGEELGTEKVLEDVCNIL